MKTCMKCPDRIHCIKPCEEIASHLKQKFDSKAKSKKEISISQTKLAEIKQGGYDEGDNANDAPEIDDFRKINLGASFAADTDQTAIWDDVKPIQGTTEDNESSSDPAVLKKINDCIQYAIPENKDRQRYRAYLGCDKQNAIAKRAGVSEQCISKKFAEITNKISEMYAKRYDAVVSNIPFKLKKAGGACRIELKK